MVKTRIVNNTIYQLGENDIDNYNIVNSCINKNQNYYWVHLNDYPSAHCIIHSNTIDNQKLVIACNMIKKKSKYKKIKKLTFCYTTISNLYILPKDKKGTVQFKTQPNNFIHTDTIIYHSSSLNGGNSSEYIIPKDKICITSHGIGTGIYGLTYSTNNNEYIFNINIPFLLETNDECIHYMEASCYLNNMLEENKNIIEIATYFYNNYYGFKNIEFITQKLKEFKNDYNNRKDIVMMPINYILLGLGYDGIYSKNTILDTFSRGNILFTKYPTKNYKLPVKYYKKSSGINKYIIKI